MVLHRVDSRPGAAVSKLAFAAAALFCTMRVSDTEHRVLAFNVLWFGAAVVWFGIMPRWSMDWIVPRGLDKEKRHLLATVAGCLRFLGGMNSGMLALSAMVLSSRLAAEPLFTQGSERQVLFRGFAAAHFSQWFLNIPGFLTRGSKRRLWPAPDTTMLTVFVIDFVMFALNWWCGTNARDEN